ncbi:HNH endonuclease [Rhodanobacter panaciterrae]|uniref:HNH endonuclease n=1 Tax=Rhodanobacter panaciterrae TaxID=490572 RepID=UPI00167BB3F5
MANFRAKRAHAFKQQHGQCFYCQLPMWLIDMATFARQRGFTMRQAMHFRCTAEHLVPRCEGGGNVQENIVAACWWCNTRRHHCKHPLPPVAFHAYVIRRVRTGRWHDRTLVRSAPKM